MRNPTEDATAFGMSGGGVPDSKAGLRDRLGDGRATRTPLSWFTADDFFHAKVLGLVVIYLLASLVRP